MELRKRCRDITYVTRQKRELFLHGTMLGAVIDTELFEECGSKNYFLCFSKEIAIDFTCVLSQLTRRLSGLLGFNVLK